MTEGSTDQRPASVVAGQVDMFSAVLRMMRAQVAGDVDEVGRCLGRAIDAVPELEAALCVTTVGCLEAMEEGGVLVAADQVRVRALLKRIRARADRLVEHEDGVSFYGDA